MAESDDPITEVDEELVDGESPGDDGLPDEAWLFGISGAMVVATAGVFLASNVPNGSAVMPITIFLGTAGLGVRARFQ
jgi:hypothetical protein